MKILTYSITHPEAEEVEFVSNGLVRKLPGIANHSRIKIRIETEGGERPPEVGSKIVANLFGEIQEAVEVFIERVDSIFDPFDMKQITQISGIIENAFFALPSSQKTTETKQKAKWTKELAEDFSAYHGGKEPPLQSAPTQPAPKREVTTRLLRIKKAG